MTVNATASNPPFKARRLPRRGLIKPEEFLLPAFTHPEVLYWYNEWKLIRDCIEGEKAVKGETVRYLPKFEGMEGGDYDAYLSGATFYNFTGRTVKAMIGSIFRRRPVVQGLPESLKIDLTRITRVANSFNVFTKFTAREILSMGRFGVLVDYPAGTGTQLKPYIASYTAENILDWNTALDPDSGKYVLTRVVLREFELDKASNGAAVYYTRYRELRLRPDADGKMTYVQIYYSAEKAHADLRPEDAQGEVIILRRGEPLPYIPFRIFGAMMSETTVEVPPLLDIAQLNVSHYRSYAHLEHGRFYTGFPIYCVMGDNDENNEYLIGPQKVWKLPLGADARLLEMNGQGLKFLENACETKEAQAASLGGRMIGVTTRSVSESDNQVKVKERNEVALLLDVATSMDEGFTTVLRWWAWMSGASKTDADKTTVEFNKDFVLDQSGAREFRAIHGMYMDGVVPIDVVYDYLRKNEVIPDWMSIEEFKKLLDKMEQFPNQPDAEARARGFPTAQSEIDEDRADSDDEVTLEAAEMAAEAAEKQSAQLAATRSFNNNPGNRSAPSTSKKPVTKKPAASKVK